MLHRNERVSRLLSRFTLLFFVASPAPPVVAAVEESRSTLHTYTPAATNDPGPFHCNDCWGLKPEERQPLPQHQTPRYRRGQHERGPRPHKNPFAKKSRSHSRGLRSLPRHALSMGSFERTVEPWQVRTVDGDTIRYGTDRIRIRGYNAPELSGSRRARSCIAIGATDAGRNDQHRPPWPRCLRPDPGRCLRERPERGRGDDGGGIWTEGIGLEQHGWSRTGLQHNRDIGWMTNSVLLRVILDRVY
jgi:micrococcal nuclease